MKFIFCMLALTACGSSRNLGSVCEPGASRCDAASYERCADDGNSWVTLADCGATNQICILNTGCEVCSANTRTCAPNGFDIQRCRDDGSGFDVVASCDPNAGDICAAGACQNACAFAEATRSYEGCEFWPVDLDNAVVADQGAAAAQQYAVVVTNPLEVPADVTIEVNDADPGMPVMLRTVATAHLARVEGGGDLAVIDLDDRGVDGASDPRLNDGPGTWFSSRAYHMTSTAPIIAYQFNPLANVKVFSNDASLLLPSSGLDGNYTVLSWPQTLAITDVAETNGGINLRGFLTIVGMQQGTNVTVTLTAPTIPGGTIPAGNIGDTLTFQLGPFDVVNLETGSFNADFTGTRIESALPITVYAGSEASDVPYYDSLADRQCCADHLEEQLFPQSSFGTQFVAVQTPSRTKYGKLAGYNLALVTEPEWWRVVAAHVDTVVTTSLPPPNDSFILQPGESATWFATQDFVVAASNGVAFGQYPGSQETTGIPSTIDGQRVPGGDPSSIIVPPVQQWRNKYVFLVPDEYEFDSILLAVPSTSGILFDGQDIMTAGPRCEVDTAGSLNVSNAPTATSFLAIRCVLSDPRAEDYGDPIYQNDGRHVVESKDGQAFGLVVWGWDSYVSYGYPGGTNTERIDIQ